MEEREEKKKKSGGGLFSLLFPPPHIYRHFSFGICCLSVDAVVVFILVCVLFPQRARIPPQSPRVDV